MERFHESYEQYLDLIKNSEDEYEDERETNLGAVLASLSFNDDDSINNRYELSEKTYELCYNKACILIGQGNYKQALEKLNAAEGNLSSNLTITHLHSNLMT